MLLFIMALVILVVLFVLAVSKREAGRSGTNTKEEFIGICASAVESASVKEDRKGQILTILSDKGEVRNSDIREVLKVSSRTVVRYLDELEREGKVEQVGRAGHAVAYRLLAENKASKLS